ncbi:MAG: type IV secretion system protein [Novosphingobium sp.]
MSCAPLQSGSNFLGGMLAQVDCQAQAIGAYGYGALADPNSPVAALLLAALTLFIALFGLRLMFGEASGGRDLVGSLVKIGIVLTLATSWPAWRTVAYQVVLDGPSQIASQIGLAAGLPGSRGDLNQRLENADQGIVALTAWGTGRLTGGVVGQSDQGDISRGIALADRTGFAWGRIAFLVGTVGPIAIVRLSAGILLALAPLMAALLLFAGTRDVFFGWLRALGACALGALVLTLVYGVELAMLESWLSDAVGQRQGNVLVPAVPTELTVIALAFAAIAWGGLALTVRVVFFAAPGWQRMVAALGDGQALGPRLAMAGASAPGLALTTPPRAQQVADAVAQSMRREERMTEMTRRIGSSTLAARGAEAGPQSANSAGPSGTEALGNSYRRTSRRSSAAASKRDSSA